MKTIRPKCAEPDGDARGVVSSQLLCGARKKEHTGKIKENRRHAEPIERAAGQAEPTMQDDIAERRMVDGNRAIPDRVKSLGHWRRRAVQEAGLVVNESDARIRGQQHDPQSQEDKEFEGVAAGCLIPLTRRVWLGRHPGGVLSACGDQVNPMVSLLAASRLE